MTLSGETLEDLGWRSFFSKQVSDEEVRRYRPVRVMTVHRGSVDVAGAQWWGAVSPYIEGAAPEDDHPTVGDWLLIDRDTRQPVRVLGRINLLSRPAPGDPARRQMIAANVDTLIVVASCNRDFSVARLERYVVLAREVGVSPVVVLTKADLTDAPETFPAAVRAIGPDLRIEIVDGRQASSVARLAAHFGTGQTVALLGSSGVGKSTLVNTMPGSDEIATGAIRASDDTGRHTTTVRQMHGLAQGGWLLDTSGMRELQVPDAQNGVSEVFDDFVTTAQHCRFSDCAHDREPGCAIRAAIADGTLTTARFDRWRRLANEGAKAAHIAKRRR